MRISDGIRRENSRIVAQFKAGGERFYKAFPYSEYGGQKAAIEAAQHFVDSRRQLFEKKRATVIVKNIHEVSKTLRGYKYLYLRLAYYGHEHFVSVGSLDKHTVEQVRQSKRYRKVLDTLMVKLEELKGESES